MKISEIFLSIQGESSYAGLPCVFVRLAGCNLSCDWCDTPYSRDLSAGEDMTVGDVVGRVEKFTPNLVEVTGGEPLTQLETPELLNNLLARHYSVLLETNGSVSLRGVDPKVVKIIDIKCPSSGHDGSFLMENISFITPDDEVKFVVSDENDYEFAKRFVEEHLGERTEKILFAPVKPELKPSLLAEWILRDGLKVRLQIQVHKYIWEDDGKGKKGI